MSAVSWELGGVDGHSGGLFPGAHLKLQRKRAKRRIMNSKRKQEEKYETKKIER
jgi:6-phosphogluconolactonase/glucosamine-6-phosphate isomerase/deaminase